MREIPTRYFFIAYNFNGPYSGSGNMSLTTNGPLNYDETMDLIIDDIDRHHKTTGRKYTATINNVIEMTKSDYAEWIRKPEKEAP